MKDGYPCFTYNYFEAEVTTIKSTKKLPDGLASIKVDFQYEGGGPGKGASIVLFINNDKTAQGHLNHTVPGRFGIDTFGIGEDSGSPVTKLYKAPFKFNDHIEEVNIVLGK